MKKYFYSNVLPSLVKKSPFIVEIKLFSQGKKIFFLENVKTFYCPMKKKKLFFSRKDNLLSLRGKKMVFLCLQ